MYDVEVLDNKFALTWSKSDGSLGIVDIRDGALNTPTPQALTQYYVELIVYNQNGAGTPYAYAYVHKASDASFVGKAGYASGSRYAIGGAQAYRMGIGAWTDTSSNPTSWYYVVHGEGGYG